MICSTSSEPTKCRSATSRWSIVPSGLRYKYPAATYQVLDDPEKDCKCKKWTWWWPQSLVCMSLTDHFLFPQWLWRVACEWFRIAAHLYDGRIVSDLWNYVCSSSQYRKKLSSSERWEINRPSRSFFDDRCHDTETTCVLQSTIFTTSIIIIQEEAQEYSEHLYRIRYDILDPTV